MSAKALDIFDFALAAAGCVCMLAGLIPGHEWLWALAAGLNAFDAVVVRSKSQ